MSQNYTTILNILDTQLSTTPGLPVLTQENILSKPDSTTSWCRSTLLPAEPNILTVGQGGQRQDQGLYQIDVFTPKGSGADPANQIADSIQNTFIRGQYLSANGVLVLVEKVWRQTATALSGTVFYQLPIIVRWSRYDSN